MLDYSKPIHILRYGTNADQKYIERFHKSFNMLALNANMVAYTPGAISQFLMQHCIERQGSFFIDPITHAFQHDIEKIKSLSRKTNKYVVKKSILNLIEAYGNPIKAKIEKDRIVTNNDFNDIKIKEAFCERVINFQINTIKTQLSEKGFLEYISDNENMLHMLEPSFVIPPYFYVTEATLNTWLPLNIDFINIAKEKFKKRKIFAQLVVSKEILTSNYMRDLVCQNYIDTNITDLLIWIDDFNEYSASFEQLSGYLDLIKKLYNHKISVYNLYGGFFSIMLTGLDSYLGFRLSGVGHGLEYGEYRAVVPVGGGIPTSKYYYFPIHQRLNYKTASELLESLGYFNCNPLEGANRYYKEICSCPKCKEIIKNNINNFSKFENTEFYEVNIRGVKQRRPYADQATKENCIFHYLYNKRKEFIYVSKLKSSILDDLTNTYQNYEFLDILDPEFLYPLKVWVKVLLNNKLK
jgi:hypothetical protein